MRKEYISEVGQFLKGYLTWK